IDRHPVTSSSKGRNIFGLVRSPADLHARIDARVDEMFARGLVKETRALLQLGMEKNRTTMQALGYRQVVEHLHGEHSLAETVALVKVRTRQFAKRQMTWFRRQLTVDWTLIEATDCDFAARFTEQIVSRLYCGTR